MNYRQMVSQLLLAVYCFFCVPGLVGIASGQSLPHEAAAKIDQLLASELDSKRSTPVKSVDDETFLRRVFIDLLGEPPTTDDVLAFAINSEKNKRSQLV